MTVETQVKKVTANGNDVATVFSFSPMIIFDTTDIEVTFTDTAGAETVLSEGSGTTDYSVAAASGSYPSATGVTGSITYPATLGTELATGESLTIKRVLTLEQQTDLENQGGYFNDVQETQFDKLVMIDLQQQEELDRRIKVPISDSVVDLTIPDVATRASKTFIWDAAGLPSAGSTTTATVSAFMETVLDDTTAAAARTTLGAGTLDDVVGDTTPQLGGFLDVNGNSIEFEMGANVASVAGDTDIWANQDGNIIHITGTNAITDFGTPNQAGQYMWLIFDAAASVVDSATITVQGNANFTAAANDLALVIALTTSTFLFIPFTNSGKLVVDVDVADLADGTDGELITWDSAGVPTTVGAGTSGQVLTSNGAGTEPTFQTLTAGDWTYTAQTATTSGTSVTLTTALPDTMTEFEVLFNDVSTSAGAAGDQPMVQVGDSGGFEATGYQAGVATITGATAGEVGDTTLIRTTETAPLAGQRITGKIRFDRWDASEHMWIVSGIILTHAGTGGVHVSYISATKTTSAALDRVQLSTPTGTATFDLGEARVRYR